MAVGRSLISALASGSRGVSVRMVFLVLWVGLGLVISLPVGSQPLPGAVTRSRAGSPSRQSAAVPAVLGCTHTGSPCSATSCCCGSGLVSVALGWPCVPPRRAGQQVNVPPFHRRRWQFKRFVSGTGPVFAYFIRSQRKPRHDSHGWDGANDATDAVGPIKPAGQRSSRLGCSSRAVE
jgi:hypothetical protein